MTQRISTRQAARKYDIPERTIRRFYPIRPA